MARELLDTSIIVACRNEEETIGRCLESVVGVLPDAEIVVVIGGADRTFAVTSQLSERWPQIKPVKNDPDLGKGHAIKRGIATASGQHMAQFDADLQFAAEDLPSLLRPIWAGEMDLTFGSRFLPESRTRSRAPFFRDFGNRLLSAYVSLLIGRRVTDVTAGIKAWTRTAIEQIDFTDLQYSYEAEIVVRAARLGLRFEEIPVQYFGRAGGKSMHRNNLMLARAGLVIAWKAFRAARRAVGQTGIPNRAPCEKSTGPRTRVV